MPSCASRGIRKPFSDFSSPTPLLHSQGKDNVRNGHDKAGENWNRP